jgi:tryptophan-rich sensory protein
MAGPAETQPEAAGTRVALTSRVPRRAYAVAAVIAVLVAGIGGLATDLGPWYRGLLQPPWKPPDIVFGPVWTVLYTLTAWAGARAWWHARPALQANEAAAQEGRRRQRLLLFGFLLNALLNVLWSVLFFKAQRPDWALAEIVLLTASVLWLISACAKVDRLAARLLLPYLAWVLFAATVNAGVLRLNPVAPGA